VLFGELFVTPLLVDYLDQYPQIQAKALLVDRVVNMAEEDIDVAIRIGDLPENNLHRVKVGTVRRVICASPGFLAEYGRPQRPNDLRDASVVLAASSTLVSDWKFMGPEGAITVRPHPPAGGLGHQP